jgi:hypothetical protein
MSRKPSKSGSALRRWRITVVRRKGESLGIVEAADVDEAIKVAIKAFGITDRSGSAA